MDSTLTLTLSQRERELGNLSECLVGLRFVVFLPGTLPAHSFNQRIERGGFLRSELMDVSVKGEHLSGAIFTDTQARP